MHSSILVRQIASAFDAFVRCSEPRSDGKGVVNPEWQGKHRDHIGTLCANYMPHGSGFDAGTLLSFQRSTPERLVFETSFHHMNDAGMYDGWTTHDVIVTPSLVHGFNLRITGRDRNGIKDYIAQAFYDCLLSH